MSVKKKLESEKSEERVIPLYRKEIFFMAYNHSALRPAKTMEYAVSPEGISGFFG